MYLCQLFEIILMKRTILAVLISLVTLAAASAQEIRTNYTSGNISHTSTEYEEITCGKDPLWVRLDKVGYKDGSSLYVIYLTFEQKTSFTAPKGVKMAFNLSGNGLVRAEQIGKDNPTKNSFSRGNTKVYWNRTKYALESGDFNKILRGITSIDVVTGWDPDDYIQMSFPGDELAALLRRHEAAIRNASARLVTLTSDLDSRANNRNSIITTTKPIVAKGSKLDYNVSLTHLYYKTNNKEDFEIKIQIGSTKNYHVPIDALVTFTFSDGSSIALKQSIDEDNLMIVLPSVRETRKLCYGVKSVSIEYEGGTINDTFPSDALSSAINQQYQLLMSASER